MHVEKEGKHYSTTYMCLQGSRNTNTLLYRCMHREGGEHYIHTCKQGREKGDHYNNLEILYMHVSKQGGG